MIVPLLAAILTFAPAPAAPDPWIAEDKVKHFFTSFVVTSLSASGARLAGADRSTSMHVGIAVGASAGVGKEVSDVRSTGIFSYRDLIWDVLGIAAAAVIVDFTR